MSRSGRKSFWFAIPALCCLWMVLGWAAKAQPAVASELAPLDDALKAVVTFEHGKDSSPLVLVERLVVEAAKDEQQRAAVEERLVRALGTASTRDAKSFLCRQLRTIGTARSVPQLEALLTDPELSHMARYALGSIEDPAAAAALHRVLGKTSGTLQIGIMNTLGDRSYRKALPDLARLLRSTDWGVAEAAAGALGQIGGMESVRALASARAGASEALREHIDNALLVCAEQFLASGQVAQAGRVYGTFYKSSKRHLRLASLRGLVAARDEQAVPLLIESIKGSDTEVRRTAIALTTMVKGSNATRSFAVLLSSLPPEDQELLLHALGARGDATAVRAVSVAMKSEHQAVRLAALDALGNMGDGVVVPALLEAAAVADGTEKQVARASLVRLRARGVNGILMRYLGSADASVRAEGVRALAGRNVTQAVGVLLRVAREDVESVRREAITALGTLAGEAELGQLVALAVRPKEATDRPTIEQAVEAVFARVGNKDGQVGLLLRALAGAPTDAKPTLMRLLGKPATPTALAAVRSALRDPNAAVRDAALRALSEWPDPSPAEELLTLAHASRDEANKLLALQGYIRMAGMSEDPTAMYVRAMELAERPEEKNLVLDGLGNVGAAEALPIVERYLNDEPLQLQAARAAVQIANRLRQEDAARARAALKSVLSVVKDPRVRKQAQDIINEMEQYEGYILAWLGAGPYMEKGKESREVFDMVFPPEKSGGEEVKWRRLTRGIGSWDINLEATFGSRDHCAAYVRTRIWSPEENDARLEMGSDDAIKAWLDGKLVHANYVNRGFSPRQDLVDVKLQKGWNDLLLKVVDHEGGWGFCCRVRKPDGSALEGSKVEAR